MIDGKPETSVELHGRNGCIATFGELWPLVAQEVDVGAINRQLCALGHEVMVENDCL